MSSTYTWPQVVNGKSYSEADFRPYTYATTLPDLLGNFAAQATNAQGAVKAAEAATSAAAAATSAAQAAGRVAGVTTGSTANLVYPEAIANLVTASDVRDVLVYDTRLDSDGGAWTLRCQHTSWWNETLNTATRGAKRDFPTVALIVLRTSGMTIYDLHDLDGSGVPRMWMVFTAGASNQFFTSGGSLPTAVAAMNGSIVTTSTGGSGSGRMLTFSFTADGVTIDCTFSRFRYSGPLAARNTVNSAIIIAAVYLPSNDMADVAMRVLPGALRDGAGLPIPTIAVAMDAGTSLIHPDGRVCNITIAGGNFRVAFLNDSDLVIGLGAGDSNFGIGPISYDATVTWASWYTRRYISAFISGFPGLTTLSAGTAEFVSYPGSNTFAVGGSAGVNFIAEEPGNPFNGMIAFATHTYATGWMPCPIGLAALCDARTGAWVDNIRLSLDGTSAAGFSSVNSGTVTSTGGRIRIARNGVVNPGGAVSLTGLTVGETYTVDMDAYIGTAGYWLLHVVSGPTNLLDTGLGSADAAGIRFQFVAIDTTALLVLYAWTNTGTQYAEFDNVTVRAGVPDRSGRGIGLHVVGSLSRAAIGTGNDVVAYSGFSASNYLMQPYSSLMDFGTGDFCAIFWAKPNGNGGYIARRASGGYGANDWSITRISGLLYFDAYGTGGATATIAENLWSFVVATRRNGVFELWINGVRGGTSANTTSFSGSGKVLFVGLDGGASTQLSMVRLAAYAPTPAQIARMFRDERPLFDTGAKALLGGASSVVNAMSYSEHSQRLAVATLDGVAVFSGLRRVEYLTTGNLSPAMASNNTSKIAMEAGALVVGTAANAGIRRDAITGLDRMLTNPRAPFAPRRLTARGFTTDATPLVLAPRLGIGERETLIVLATVVGRVYGAADGQRLSYQRRATYYRDAGGNVTLQGSVQTIGTDTEVTGTADATLVIDTTAQTVAPQVTGVAATRIVWTATLEVTRIADAQYEELV